MASALFTPLTLPNGSTLPNRIGKSAMAENMAAQGQLPDEHFVRLYQRFADGGAGLIVTGNVMVDDNGVSTAGDVVLTKNSPIAPFQAWANAAKSKGAQVWMQINHPGRQAMAGLGKNTFAPSAIGLELGKHSKLFVKPRAMSEQEIANTITRFAETAQAAEQAGFSGVQIHAAHGYLISQFLSPLSNQRSDQWGGSIENRARFLLAIVAAIRAVVSPGFTVAVKINSADFQRGGFDESDALAVVEMLNGTAVDLVELSGGSYESPTLFSGEAKDNRTLAREAYFLEFAAKIAKVAKMPLMTTGGIRRLAVAEAVLEEGIAVAGIATALALNPNLPNEWKNGQAIDGKAITLSFKDKTLRGLAQLIIVQRHLQRLGKGKPAGVALNPIWTLVSGQIRDKYLINRYKKWISSQ
ncbi:NADH:flavin oxidoreductase/NADH oxidase family protein [Paralysiella testudinis]|uniref:NADH:flavin oxidoreductase/NADH oxidase family protein n=1 Tax=Paralysiella testudinis TaxID=2809020 RepID=A0A892ZFK9_9NEIS|nr:NADH:flavin oxidoreductase/NADH oxidase family protein [Paralysiella testudinis]QRQ81423.1 NADH:flavin oxidoreductase/NADH oxidase family protein [Paralysiella testudinis]